jgi:DNA-binding NtrC family response regulator
MIERVLALSEASQIGPEDFPVDPASGEQRETSTTDLARSAAERRLTLRELEVRYIDEIMQITGGNKVHAAKILGVDRKTLYRRAERRNSEGRKAQN